MLRRAPLRGFPLGECRRETGECGSLTTESKGKRPRRGVPRGLGSRVGGGCLWVRGERPATRGQLDDEEAAAVGEGGEGRARQGGADGRASCPTSSVLPATSSGDVFRRRLPAMSSGDNVKRLSSLSELVAPRDQIPTPPPYIFRGNREVDFRRCPIVGHRRDSLPGRSLSVPLEVVGCDQTKSDGP
jgi:hypothetical protein